MPAPNTPAALVTLADLEADPHPALARLRAAAPVSWVPALGAWLVTGYDLAVEVLRDARTFTVDDPRFSTAKVVGPSMLSLDGAQHARHRGPFNRAFRRDEVHARLASFTWAETGRLVSAIEPRGAAELRRAVAGPLAVAVMAEALGLGPADPGRVLAWYDGIVAAVQAEAATAQAGDAGPAGTAAFAELAASLREVIAAPESASLLSQAGPLTEAEAISNAAVMMFGGIETTEGMIANALLHLLSSPAQLELVLADRGLVPAAVEESLRLEPAAAVVDRYATRDARLGGAGIRAGDQVTVSIAGANRDPAVFGRARPVRRPPSQRWTPSGLRARPAFLPRRPPGPAGGAGRHRNPARPAPPAAPGSPVPQRAARPGLPQAARPARALEPIGRYPQCRCPRALSRAIAMRPAAARCHGRWPGPRSSARRRGWRPGPGGRRRPWPGR